MKKGILFLLIGILLIGVVSIMAQQEGLGMQSNSEISNQQKVKAGNYTGEGGQQIQIKEQSNNRFKLKINGIEVDCDGNLTQEQVQNKTKLKMKLSNGKNAEIKIMPDTASETALQRLRLKVCSEENNCTIQLKEVGKGNQTQAAYEIQAQRHARLLGMFRLKMQTRAQISAENGDIIKVKKPWWAFLATEPEE